MKKFLCLMLAVITVTLCGCDAAEMFSVAKQRVRDTYNDIFNKEKTRQSDTGTFIAEKIDKKELTDLEETDIKADDELYCYNKLSNKQKKIYKIFLTAADVMPDGWFACNTADGNYTSDVSVAYKALLCDNPQFFWLPSSYMIAKSGKKVCVAFKLSGNGFENDYLVSKEQKSAMEITFNQKVLEITASANTLESDFDKELYIHDYLCQNTLYNSEGGERIYTAYGAIVDGVCVCEGYSRACELLLRKVGIPCGLVYGEYDSKPHMWNYVLIGGSIYHLDVTWDDDETVGQLHEYFNITTEEALITHTIYDAFDVKKDYGNSDSYYNFLTPVCTDTKDNYYERNQLYFSDDVSATADATVRCFNAGYTVAELKITATREYEDLIMEINRKIYKQYKITGYSLSNGLMLMFK